ncbi:MAG: RsmB/NOP family class I SAM-dependent RNA methyltransferase [Azospirillum sp.]|nr:RsmB/NOP family class I SAM-dependent RNA methyltransferase [Azospirillum sp.]
MQKGAQYQAVWELISEIFKDKMPADNIINAYVRERKYIGSKDRRFITETVWKIIRNRRKLVFDAGSNEPRRVLLTYLQDEDFDLLCGGEYGLAPLSKEEKEWLKRRNEEVYPAAVEAECPDWLFDKVKDIHLLKALNEPASADLRLNKGSRARVIEQLQGEGLYFVPTPYSPIGIRSAERVNLNNCVAYKEGVIEVQDEASQLAAILADVRPEHKIIDYCCGAGGKSLTMAFLMNRQGKIQIHDINRSRLEAVKERAVRLDVKNLEIIDEVGDRDYDRFVVDAPCSGTGTWRRSPDAKYRLTPETLKELNKTQAELLEKAFNHIRRGGRVVYITCSILRDENEDIIEAFLSRHADAVPVNLRHLWEDKLDGRYPGQDDFMLRMNPLLTRTDGFFVCILEKR